MRLDKYVSKALDISRSKADILIKNKNIKVNNNIITISSYDIKDDEVSYLDKILIYEEYIYLMLNKPKGYVTSTKDQNKIVMDLIDEYKTRNLFPVGRLDIDTEGLLLITNDGVFSHKLTHPKNHIPKIYDVITDNMLNDEEILNIEKGLDLPNFKTLPANIKVLNVNHYEITIYAGQFHELKKIFAHANIKVLALKRIKIGELELGDLPLASYRKLTEEEINKLKNL